MHYQPPYNTSHTMKSSDPLLLADGNLHYGMYLAGKVAISRHLIIPGFPRCDHTVDKLSADAGVNWNEAYQTSWPLVILKCQPPICLDYRARNKPHLALKSTHHLSRQCLFFVCPIHNCQEFLHHSDRLSDQARQRVCEVLGFLKYVQSSKILKILMLKLHGRSLW